MAQVSGSILTGVILLLDVLLSCSEAPDVNVATIPIWVILWKPRLRTLAPSSTENNAFSQRHLKPGTTQWTIPFTNRWWFNLHRVFTHWLPPRVTLSFTSCLIISCRLFFLTPIFRHTNDIFLTFNINVVEFHSTALQYHVWWPLFYVFLTVSLHVSSLIYIFDLYRINMFPKV